jgi:hypothetical protein
MMVLFKQILMYQTKIHYRQLINLPKFKIINSLIQFQQLKIHQLEILESNLLTIKTKSEFKAVLDHHSLH